MSSNGMASFPTFGGDFPSIDFIVLHSLVDLSYGSVSPRTVSMCFSSVYL